MSIFIEREYISLLSNRLEGFTQKRKGIYNCRCPICGDSQKSKRKKRMYFFVRKGKYNVRCHNCGYSVLFGTFLKKIDTEIHKQYVMALFQENRTTKQREDSHKKHIKQVASEQAEKRKTTGFDYSPLKHFKTLSDTHPARSYVEKRMLPLDRIYYCDNFAEYVITLDIDQYIIDQFDHMAIPVMIIPFFISNKISRVFQVRTFDPNFKPKYITFKLDEDDLKIFGMDRIHPHKPVYVLEGPLDAMCLENAIAFSGISSELPDKLKDYNLVYFLDNEPRNREVVKQIHKLISNNQKVVLLENVPYGDVNEMHVAGIDVVKLFKQNTYSGIVAEMKFNNWKKV